MNNTELYDIKNNFLKEWPLSRIQNMTLQEYTNLEKTSFCYWLEAITTDVGSIWGGSAYKFGIYKRRDTSTTITVDNRITDGEYAWFQKYGTTREEAFQTVKHIIIKIINNSIENKFEEIDSIDLGGAYKWKIAFLYGDFNLINIFKNESLFEAALSLGYKGNDKSYSILNRFILSKKDKGQEFFEFTQELWQKTSLANPKKYWIYAPGENANKWEEFYNEGIIGLGWDELGDLDNYESKKDIKNRLQELEGEENSKQNDTAANYEFHKVIKEGDVIIVKKGINQLLGYGIVISDYYYDEIKTSYQKCRKVEWKLKGNWKLDFNLPLKTLTDITKLTTEDPMFSKYYEKLLSIMENNTVSKYNYKEDFSNWIRLKKPKDSGSINSYLRAIELLSETIGYIIFEENEVEKLQKLYENLIEEQKIEGGKYWNSKAPSYGIKGFYSAAIRTYVEFHNEIKIADMSNSLKLAPLNQILYGPPGTGKTYNTVLEAAKIVTGNEAITYHDALRIFNDNLGNQIEFITFHQNYSYEDFIQGIRPDTENGKELTFEKKDGVFKRIADRALDNLLASENPARVKKDFDLVFNELIQPLNEGDIEEIEIKMKKSSFFITEVGEKSIDFRKSIGDSKHTLSINTLRKMYNSGSNDIILGGLQPYYNPILSLLLEKGKSQEIAVPIKNYVIIIDEINRANISRVFGELITLIEDDKRSHGAIPMRVTLPSGDPFIVPSNLYIIGTMNTADKSIALLDIALRRRFDFVPMYPLYEGLEKPINDVELLQKINDAILSRKNHDFTIGHAYFMGMDYTLENTINKKVIPLLLEYFMNDEKEVTSILQLAGIKIGGWPLKMI
jgi:5-methylcytosine-specific restriction endonuclease McrBC GTP-binding regulatory subunit McrB